MSAGPAVRPAPITVRPVDPLAGTAFYFWTLRLCAYGLLLIGVWGGSPLLCIGALLAGVLLPFTDHAGGIWCGSAFAAIATTLAGTIALAFPLAMWASAALGWPLLPTALAAFGMVLVPCLYICGQVGVWLSRPLRRLRYGYVLNRTVGTGCGLAAGATVAATLGWVFAIFGPAIASYSLAAPSSYPNITRMIRYVEGVRRWVVSDPSAGWLDRHNPMRNVELITLVANRAELSADNHRLWQTYYAGGFDELLEVPVIRKYFLAVKADKDMRAAIEEHDLVAILKSGHFTAALNDDELCEAVAQRWPEVRSKVSDQQIRAAQVAVSQLDPTSRARFDELVRRAREYDVELPVE